MAASDLFDAAAELLAACGAAVATTDAGAIDYAFVSPGLPALDCCPMLAVHAGGLGEGDTSPFSPPFQPGHRTATAVVPLVSLTVTVVRCVPGPDKDGNPPTPADLSAAAVQTNADLWAIWNELRRAKRADTLFAPREREFFFDPAFPINIQGGCAGWLIPVRVALSGYSSG